MQAYNLLSVPIKKYIRDKKWDSFRPIQQAAIVKIMTTQNHYILAARTASGKTEAAFLPVLSSLDFAESGVQVLYISPLIALINDQFRRVNELCKYLDVRVTKWHGEANRSEKKALLKSPSGILLITPESIEAMFVNRPYQVKHLLSNVKFIIIDEIHSFLGTERGMQLKSLLFRISEKTNNTIRYIGLSATLGDYYDSVKSFFGQAEQTKVLRDNTAQQVNTAIYYYSGGEKDLPVPLLADLYKVTQKYKTLIFPNSRGRVEELAVKLRKIAIKNNGHFHYYAHHSSISRELREFIEQFVKQNKRHNFAIACTSTLELGIDIGSVDLVAQVDSTFSVASLAQRLGRSGRKEGQHSNLLLCATQKWSLLQSLACYELFKEKFVEPLLDIPYPVDILFHQIISIVKENSSIHKRKLFQQLEANPAFKTIPADVVLRLVKFMIAKEFLENLDGEIIIGLQTAPLLSGRTFYTVFQTTADMQVMVENKMIGEIPPSPQIVPDQNIFLAANIWTIEEVDYKQNKIFVKKAKDGEKPLFYGTGGNIHQRVREKMLELVCRDYPMGNADATSKEIMRELRHQFREFDLTDFTTERPVFVNDYALQFFSFASSKINQTLFFLFKRLQKKALTFHETQSCFEFKKTEFSEFQDLLQKCIVSLSTFDALLDDYYPEHQEEFPVSKWGAYLPTSLKKEMLLTSYFMPEDTMQFLLGLELSRSELKQTESKGRE